MSPDTKKVALEKLAAFRPKIGYPDKWRDYSALSSASGDAFGNACGPRCSNGSAQVDRLGKPTDRDEWGMTPQTINAYYNPTFNEVVFPAAILQPPFFDPQRRRGRELRRHRWSHRSRDGPRLRRPGLEVRRARRAAHLVAAGGRPRRFARAFDRLAAQYDQFEALPGLNVNGRLTLGREHRRPRRSAVAYEAYHLSLDGQAGAGAATASRGDQRFFLVVGAGLARALPRRAHCARWS